MKRTFTILLIASILPFESSFGQPNARQEFTQRLQAQAIAAAKMSEQPLTKFDLDFRGGTPGQLVAAIEKATGKPLNAIVPDEFANVQLPALRMKSVTVPQLFEALESASRKNEAFVTGTYLGPGGHASSQYQTIGTSYGFRTQNPVREDAVWYFRRDICSSNLNQLRSIY